MEISAGDVEVTNNKASETVVPALDSKITDAVAARHSLNRDARAQKKVEVQKVARDRRRSLRRDKKAATALAMIVFIYMSYVGCLNM